MRERNLGAWPLTIALRVLLLALLVAPAAGAVTITGATLVPAPSVVERDAFDVEGVLVWVEAEAFVLQEALRLNGGVVVPAGTTIDSYYMVFDPPARTWLESEVGFGVPVLGIAWTTKRLRRSDFLATSIDYKRFHHRGLETTRKTSGRDRIAISDDGMGVAFRVRAHDPGDAVRVIVAHVPVPEPGTALLVGGGCAALALRRRRA